MLKGVAEKVEKEAGGEGGGEIGAFRNWAGGVRESGVSIRH